MTFRTLSLVLVMLCVLAAGDVSQAQAQSDQPPYYYVADLDGDGVRDVVYVTPTSPEIVFFFSTKNYAYLPSAPLFYHKRIVNGWQYTAGSWGDYAGDGFGDFFVRDVRGLPNNQPNNVAKVFDFYIFGFAGTTRVDIWDIYSDFDF